MMFRRSTLLLLCGFTILLSAVAALVFRQVRGDDLDSTLWMNALLVFVGLVVLARATLGPPAQVLKDRCARCGGQTFETTRSLDRVGVRTCFSCGSENASVTGEVPRPPKDAPREPSLYPGHRPSTKQ